MARKITQLDVLVLGDHPSASLAAAILAADGQVAVAHATWPPEPHPDRLVLVNPKLFDLHPLLKSLPRQLQLTELFGAAFLGDRPDQAAEYRDKSPLALVAEYADLRDALRQITAGQGVAIHDAKTVKIAPPDDRGVVVTLGRSTVHAKVLVVAYRPDPVSSKALGIPAAWPGGVVHRMGLLRWERAGLLAASSKPLLPMSLDVDGTLHWAWLLTTATHLQAMVEHPIGTEKRLIADLMQKWLQVLADHGVISQVPTHADRHIQSVEQPFAGALDQEGVCDRTLLIGPAGGFITACGEEIYPSCWSAVHAAAVLTKALKDKFLQDALQPFRHQWRTTLGDYLRGPQQNLRFLLPLVYRNPTMTRRLVEAILAGKSVVR